MAVKDKELLKHVSYLRMNYYFYIMAVLNIINVLCMLNFDLAPAAKIVMFILFLFLIIGKYSLFLVSFEAGKRFMKIKWSGVEEGKN
jgi:hypothetical protein